MGDVDEGTDVVIIVDRLRDVVGDVWEKRKIHPRDGFCHSLANLEHLRGGLGRNSDSNRVAWVVRVAHI